jgi:hypothetical protein
MEYLLEHPDKIQNYIPKISPNNPPIAIQTSYTVLPKYAITKWKSRDQHNSNFNNRWKKHTQIYYVNYDHEISKETNPQIIYEIPQNQIEFYKFSNAFPIINEPHLLAFNQHNVRFFNYYKNFLFNINRFQQ